MYGAMIGDIFGSKYEFHNIKTKDFPLFARDCDFNDDTIMTVAVAKAIMLSREEQYHTSANGKSFQHFLIETMQDFGRRYPHPKGEYGTKFSLWLRQNDPAPYDSFGNGAAMRVSPCGLAAVHLDEARALARFSAAVSHNHPEGIKGAEAVACAIFLAKIGKSKEEIGKYIRENYYDLDFTLDSIRDAYSFDGSCQGSVPQAIVAFLESNSFEDSIKNAVSIGGDTDTIGAITGSIAWVYYTIQRHGYSAWVQEYVDGSMQEIRRQAKEYLPDEFVQIAEQFHEACWRRAGTYERVGFCTPILNGDEQKQYVEECLKRPKENPPVTLDEKTEKQVEDFCRKYVVLAELLYRDKELNQWCRNFSSRIRNTSHRELLEILFEMIHDADVFMRGVLMKREDYTNCGYSFESALKGNRFENAFGICVEIRASCHRKDDGIINSFIPEGRMYQLMRAFLSNGRPLSENVAGKQA